jgi:hypothetical protein
MNYSNVSFQQNDCSIKQILLIQPKQIQKRVNMEDCTIKDFDGVESENESEETANAGGSGDPGAIEDDDFDELEQFADDLD